MLKIERNPPTIRVLQGAKELWTGRTDANPPEYIRYPDGHSSKAIRIDQSTDAEILHAVELKLLGGELGEESLNSH
jgi:hypothetical protein